LIVKEFSLSKLSLGTQTTYFRVHFQEIYSLVRRPIISISHPMTFYFLVGIAPNFKVKNILDMMIELNKLSNLRS